MRSHGFAIPVAVEVDDNDIAWKFQSNWFSSIREVDFMKSLREGFHRAPERRMNSEHCMVQQLFSRLVGILAQVNAV